MKKKLMLLLPALLALSACGVANPNDYGPDVFQEDTRLHEELFEEAQPIFEGKAARSLVPEGSGEPYIGIQSKTFTESAKEYISIRFVAALTLASDETVVQWTRSIYKDDGYLYAAKGTTTVACDYKYTSIYDNGSLLNIKTVGSSYTHFVAYTIRKIPLEDFGDHYINISLTIGGEASNKTVSTTIDQERQVAFDSSKTGYILGGTFDGKCGSIAHDNPTANPSQNTASFSARLKANDNFLLILNDAGEETPQFLTYPNTVLENEALFTKTNGKINTTADGDYTLFLSNEDNLIYPATRTFFFSAERNSWATGALPGYTFSYDTTSKSYTLSLDSALVADETFGIRCTAYTYWAQNKNVWDSCGFTIDGTSNNVKVSETGEYVIHLYPEDVNNPIGLEKTGITPRPTGTNLYIRGSSPFTWDASGHTNELSASSREGYKYEIKNVTINTGTQFKIASYGNWVQEWGYWGYKNYGGYQYPSYYFTGTASGKFTEGDGGDDKNIKCTDGSGTFDIYITNENKLVIDNHA